MRDLWKGNEAIAEAAVRAGVDAFFGYPITPQTELLEYMAARMPELGREFLQAESEIAAIHMVYGASCAGARAMTSTSSPGYSLMQEGLSYIVASEVPALVVDVMRAGPGLGNIQASQSDYFQITKSAGHGDYHPLVFAPSTLQEAVDLTFESVELAWRYRTLVVIAADGSLGQMMEPVSMPQMREGLVRDADWALNGAKKRPARFIDSLELDPRALEERNNRLQEKLGEIASTQVRFEEFLAEDAEVLVVAYGTVARIARSAVRQARAQGIRAGMLRPITLWPFPGAALRAISRDVLSILVVEMSAGQMVEDVRCAVDGNAKVHFRGHTGGMIPLPDEIFQEISYLRTVDQERRLVRHRVR